MLVVAIGGGGLISGIAIAGEGDQARHRGRRRADRALSVDVSRDSRAPSCRSPPPPSPRASRSRSRASSRGEIVLDAWSTTILLVSRGRHRAGDRDAAGDREDRGRRRRRAPGSRRCCATAERFAGTQGRPGAVRRQHRPAGAGRHHRARHGARRPPRAHPRRHCATCRARWRARPRDRGRQTPISRRSHHQRAFTTLAVQNAELEFVLQTRGPEHIEEVLHTLRNAGLFAEIHPY